MENMTRQKIPKDMLDLLENGTFAYLCTTDKNWMPHIATIFYIFDLKTHAIYFITSPTSKKYRNLLNYPRLSLTVDRRDIQNPFNNEGLLVRGKALPVYQFWSPELKFTLNAMEQDQRGSNLFTSYIKRRYISREDYKASETILRMLSLFQEKYPQFLASPGRDVEVVAGGLERVMVELHMISISYWRGPKFKKFKMSS